MNLRLKRFFASMAGLFRRGKWRQTGEEARRAFSELRPAVIKSQVLVGGRGKAGGIKFPQNEAEAQKFAKELLELSIKGNRVRKLLGEQKIIIEEELLQHYHRSQRG